MVQKVGHIRAMKVLLELNQRRFGAYPQALPEWERLNTILDNPWKICEASFKYQMQFPTDDQIAFDVGTGTFVFSNITRNETYQEFLQRIGPQIKGSSWNFPSFE